MPLALKFFFAHLETSFQALGSAWFNFQWMLFGLSRSGPEFPVLAFEARPSEKALPVGASNPVQLGARNCRNKSVSLGKAFFNTSRCYPRFIKWHSSKSFVFLTSKIHSRKSCKASVCVRQNTITKSQNF